MTAADGGTLIDDVERLLEKAIDAKSRTVRLADRAARLYAPFVHATAALTAIGWLIAGASVHDAVVTAIAVLIITCPCALALAIPAVQVVASSALFRCGVILNAGDAIERLAEVDTVIFDKTGTLTLPEPRVDEAAPIAPGSPRAGGPARAVEPSSARRGARPRGARAPALCGRRRGAGPGRSSRHRWQRGPSRQPRILRHSNSTMRPTGSPMSLSVIAFSHAGKQAIFAFRQRIRSDAATVVAALRQLGLDVRILSGDRASAVAPVAAALGLQDWAAELKPAGKIAVIESLKTQGRRVLMVGDGLNDAPALAAAHVSMSPISAADITQAQADAVFLGDRLLPVLEAITSARRAKRLMKQNLWLAVIYNAIAVPIAIAGYVTPLIAAAAMSGSSFLVTLNALRANRATARRLDGARIMNVLIYPRARGAGARADRPGARSCGRCAAANTTTSTALRCASCRTTTSKVSVPGSALRCRCRRHPDRP